MHIRPLSLLPALLCFTALLLSVDAVCPGVCTKSKRKTTLSCNTALTKTRCEVKKCGSKLWYCRERPLPLPKTCANVYGDPHISTFDRLSYDCQVKGEFILTKVKKKIAFEVQGRFKKVDTRNPTVMSAFVVQHKRVPRIQVTIVKPTEIPSSIKPTMINTCPVVFHISRKYKQVAMGTMAVGSATAEIKDTSITIDFTSGVSIRAEINSAYGCFISRLTVCVPPKVISVGGLTGLFGNPNRNPLDDWMSASGKAIALPTDLRPAENSYCSENWCIKPGKVSLFSYFETGSTAESNGGCGGPKPATDVDVTMAPDNIKALCGTDYACLVDGIMGGEDGAQIALDVTQAIDEEADLLTNFKCDPNNILAGTVANILVTMDVSDIPSFYVEGLESFVAKEIDPVTGMPDGVIVNLQDNGSSENGDVTAGDLIFTGELAYASATAGETISFKVIPIINGDEAPASAMVAIANAAVRSFSPESGLGKVQGPQTTVVVPSLDGLELKATYSWQTGQVDLDTNTVFLGDQGGFGCFGFKKATKIVNFMGDEEGEGSREKCMVKLDKSKKMGMWTDKGTVNFLAGWHKKAPSVGAINPVTLTVTLVKSDTKKEVPNTRMSTAIAPGVQKECAERVVASMDVEVKKENVVLSLKRSN